MRLSRDLGLTLLYIWMHWSLPVSKWGFEEFKTEPWKDCLDKTKFVSGSENKRSGEQTDTNYGSKTLGSHFDNFWELIENLRNEEIKDNKDNNKENIDNEFVENEELIMSLNTYRIIWKETPSGQKHKEGLMNDIEEEGSVIIYDVSPSHLFFTSENDETPIKGR